MRPSYKRTRVNFRKLFRFLTNFVTKFSLKPPNYSSCLTEKHEKITCFQGGALQAEFLGHQVYSLFYNVLIDNVKCKTAVPGQAQISFYRQLISKSSLLSKFYDTTQQKNPNLTSDFFFNRTVCFYVSDFQKFQNLRSFFDAKSDF